MQYKFIFLNVFAIYLFLLSNSFSFIYTSFDRIQLGWIRSLSLFSIIKLLEITNAICPKIYWLILQVNIFKPAIVYQKSV